MQSDEKGNKCDDPFFISRISSKERLRVLEDIIFVTRHPQVVVMPANSNKVIIFFRKCRVEIQPPTSAQSTR
jgi:hypothetical protein